MWVVDPMLAATHCIGVKSTSYLLGAVHRDKGGAVYSAARLRCWCWEVALVHPRRPTCRIRSMSILVEASVLYTESMRRSHSATCSASESSLLALSCVTYISARYTVEHCEVHDYVAILLCEIA